MFKIHFMLFRPITFNFSVLRSLIRFANLLNGEQSYYYNSKRNAIKTGKICTYRSMNLKKNVPRVTNFTSFKLIMTII